MFTFINRLRRPHIWKRIATERLTEPLHVNLASMIIALAGSTRSRIAHDLIIRPHNAYCILSAADQARRLGLRSLTLLEFGVATGAGLMNMAHIAALVTRATGVSFRLYGFDTGAGMPPPLDYRDHPDLYSAGDFRMDQAALRAALPENASLVIGDVAETVPGFLAGLSYVEPIAYIVFDVDYYSSARAALEVLKDQVPEKYLPVTLAYFDDVGLPEHNSWCGELLSIREFNQEQSLRKIERDRFLADRRIYKRADWIKQVYSIHMLDHPARRRSASSSRRVLDNPYLRNQRGARNLS